MLARFLHERREVQEHRLDFAGSALLSLGAGALMLVMIQAHSLSLAAIIALTVCGAFALFLMIRHERRAPEPIFPADLWRTRVIALGNFAGFASGAVVMAVGGYLPTYVQGAMGESVLSGGMALAAGSVSWTFAAVIAGRLMVRTSYRLAAVIGGISLVVGCVMLAALEPARGLAWATTGSFVIGIGMGFCITAFVVSIQASVDWNQRGVATSSFMFMRIVGQSVGAAVFGAVLNFDLYRRAPEAGDLVNRLLNPGLRRTLGTAELASLSDAIASSLHLVFVLACVAAAVTLVLAWALPAALSPTRSLAGGKAQS